MAVDQDEREQQISLVGLSRYTKTQLLTICEAIGAPVVVSASRTEIIVTLMREAGFKLKKAAPLPVQTKQREFTPEELEWMLYTWLRDEEMLLRSIANGIKDLIVLRDLNTEVDATQRAKSMPLAVLRQRLADTLDQLRYYQQSSNLKSMVGMHHIVNPNAKLDF